MDDEAVCVPVDEGGVLPQAGGAVLRRTVFEADLEGRRERKRYKELS